MANAQNAAQPVYDQLTTFFPEVRSGDRTVTYFTSLLKSIFLRSVTTRILLRRTNAWCFFWLFLGWTKRETMLCIILISLFGYRRTDFTRNDAFVLKTDVDLLSSILDSSLRLSEFVVQFTYLFE
jgi:hypothetical protein